MGWGQTKIRWDEVVAVPNWQTEACVCYTDAQTVHPFMGHWRSVEVVKPLFMPFSKCKTKSQNVLLCVQGHKEIRTCESLWWEHAEVRPLPFYIYTSQGKTYPLRLLAKPLAAEPSSAEVTAECSVWPCSFCFIQRLESEVIVGHVHNTMCSAPSCHWYPHSHLSLAYSVILNLSSAEIVLFHSNIKRL